MAEMIYKNIYLQSPLPTLILDAQGLIIDANPAFKALAILPETDFISTSISSYIPNNDNQRLILSQLLTVEITEGRLDFQAHGSVPASVIVTSAKTFDENNDTAIVFFIHPVSSASEKDIDITQLENDLRNEKRFSVFGHLAPGIVHNINNPLAVIIGRAQLLKAKNPKLPGLDIIQSQAQSINSMITTLSFKSNHELIQNEVPLNLSDLLHYELDFLEADPFYKHNVEKKLDLSASIPMITGTYSDFSTGLMSIVNFSLDTMLNTDIKTFSVSLYADPQFIYIDISDTGAPIDKKQLATIFSEPPPEKQSKRMGKQPVDLYYASRILHKYQATIDIMKNTEEGKVFQVKIPH
ncbi:MAG: hypothetical protein L6422_03220 [Candidatus Marinimicrobia bacterium]|nr:hypothetical protein [Candidatus Neomarinimicrobiota bacterium]